MSARGGACVALAVTALSAGCGGSASAPAPPGTGPLPAVTAAAAIIEHPTVGGQPALLALPRRHTDRVVLYVHGAAETARSTVTDPLKGSLVAALLRAGYAVAGSDAHGDNWGAPASVTDYVRLVRRLEHRGLTDVYVLAQSMGGLDAVALIDRIRPRAWAGIYAACDLGAVYALGGLAAEQIRAAYGAAPGWRPATLSPAPAEHVAGLAMIFWASPGDTIIPKRSNTDRCAADARDRGAHVTVIATRGDHGDPSNFDARRLVAFFDAAGPAARG